MGISEVDAVRILNRDFSTFDTAAHGGKPDGKVSLNDLRAIAADPNASTEDRDTANYLLTHKDVLDSLDTAAKGGKPDGTISDKDASVFAQRLGGVNGMDETKALKVLNDDFSTTFDTAAHGGKPDGKVSRNDLVAVANNPNASADDRAAANYLLTHKDVLDKLDTAADGGKPDGTISKKDAKVLAIENWGNTHGDNVSLQDNVNIARGLGIHACPKEFYDKVKTDGQWDYKNQSQLKSGTDKNDYNANGDGGFSQADLDWFGNYNFGVVSHAYGLPLAVTLAGAGDANVLSQGGKNGIGAGLGSAYASIPILGGPAGLLLSPFVDLGAEGLTNLGFTWGDNKGDSKAIQDGWNSGWA